MVVVDPDLTDVRLDRRLDLVRALSFDAEHSPAETTERDVRP